MIRLDDLTGDGAGLTTGQVFAREFDAFAHDSRNVRGGELFVAVRTSRADGHDFIADAVARGATGVIAEDRRDLSWLGARGVTLVTVDDVRLALRAWARRHLATLAPRVIAVTGTAGKTTTTKAIATVLTHLDRDHHAPSGSSTVFENDNYNDLLGLPLSLARLGPAHRHAVIELGTDRAGEISALTDLVRPGIAVVTGVIPDAEPFATDPETAIAEYLSILDHAPALAILNRDDARLHQYATTLNPVSGNTQFLWIGTHPEADIRATDVTATPDGLSMKVQIGREIHAVMVGLHGTHWVPTVLATVAVARHLGYGIEKVIDALASIRPVSGRLRPLSGTCGMRVIDDTFSATPASVEAAFNALEVFPRPRLVVLGDAGDTPLPASTVANLGAHLARVADAVIAHGDVADAIVRAARGTTGPSGSLHTVHTRADAVARIRAIAGIPADGGAERMGGEGACQWTVLVKGNARARMEGVVERVLANPSCANETLVRQTPGHVTGIVRPGHDRPAWVEIDLGAIASNLRAIRTAVAPASVMAVLKADAYGHGAVRVARTVLAGGATFLATAVLTEASTLREAGIDAPILVLGHTPPWQARTAVRLGVAVTLFDFDGAHHLSEAAIAYGRKVPVHLKVDTGLHRIGLGSSEVVALPGRLVRCPDWSSKACTPTWRRLTMLTRRSPSSNSVDSTPSSTNGARRHCPAHGMSTPSTAPVRCDFRRHGSTSSDRASPSTASTRVPRPRCLRPSGLHSASRPASRRSGWSMPGKRCRTEERGWPPRQRASESCRSAMEMACGGGPRPGETFSCVGVAPHWSDVSAWTCAWWTSMTVPMPDREMRLF